MNEAEKSMFEIQLSEPRYSICDCCGGRLTNLTRFVIKDDNAFAIYHATFGASHPEKGVLLAIGIDNDWSESESLTRVSFPCWIFMSNNEYRVSVTDKAESPWNESKVLGKMLDRQEALEHRFINEVFHLIDHIVEEDTDIKGLFEGEIIH